MVKILFVGDTHLDIAQPHAIARQRKKEFQGVFQQIIDAALSNRVDLVCHLGDLFDNRRPSPVEVKFVLTQLLRLHENGIQFYLIRGNHEGSADIEDLFSGWAGEYIELPEIPSIQLIDPSFDEARQTQTVGYRDFSDQIRIYGIGHYRHETLDVIRKYLPLESIDPSKFNILLLHGMVETVNDAYPFTRSETILPADEIAGLNCDLVALGHSHSQVEPKQLQRTTFFSPGSPIDWDFLHIGSHGFYLAEIDGAAKRCSFEWRGIETEYVMKYLKVDGKGQERHQNWFQDQLRKGLTDLLNSTGKKLILGVNFKGTYSSDSPRFDIPTLHTSIQEFMGDRLLCLGTLSLKGLQYKALQEVDIQNLREIKMDEEQIREILEKSIDPDLANLLLDVYKEVEKTYDAPQNLTGKRKELKGNVSETLQTRIGDQIKEYYRGKITDAELENVTFAPFPFPSPLSEEPAPAKRVRKQKQEATPSAPKKARKTKPRKTSGKIDQFL